MAVSLVVVEVIQTLALDSWVVCKEMDGVSQGTLNEKDPCNFIFTGRVAFVDARAAALQRVADAVARLPRRLIDDQVAQLDLEARHVFRAAPLAPALRLRGRAAVA